MLLMKPGAIGPLISLQEARKHSYESVRAAHNAALVRRRENGVPLTDAVDWRDVESLLDATRQAAQAQDAEKVRKSASDIASATNVSVSEWEEYKPRAELDGINIRLRTISAEMRADLIGLGAEISRGMSALPEHSVRERLTKDVELQRVQMKMVQHALAYIDGLQILDDAGRLVPYSASAGTDELLADQTVEMLRDAGLLLDLFVVCRDFQGLSPLERGHYGRQVLSNSQS